jgi:hypothetical protein
MITLQCVVGGELANNGLGRKCPYAHYEFDGEGIIYTVVKKPQAHPGPAAITEVSALQQRGIPQTPKPFMGCNKAFPDPALSPGREIGRSVNHEFQHVQQFPRYLEVALVACMMECDKDLVGQTPGVTRLGKGVGSCSSWSSALINVEAIGVPLEKSGHCGP